MTWISKNYKEEVSYEVIILNILFQSEFELLQNAGKNGLRLCAVAGHKYYFLKNGDSRISDWEQVS